MKKQILFLTLFVLAITASNFSAIGQTLAPRTITCLPEDALHPVAGKEYTYQIDVPVTPNPGDAWVSLEYLWFVTQLDLTGTADDLFIDNGVLRSAVDDGTGSGTFIANASADYTNYPTDSPDGTSEDNVMTLTWKNIVYDATKPLFVVIETTGETTLVDGTTTCETKNMKVFKIEPLLAFTLDIDNLQTDGSQHTPTAYGDKYDQCIDDIVSARWNETDQEVEYDFGVNYLYYEVVAANWGTEWGLFVELSGVDPLEDITVEWSADKTFASGVTEMTTTDSHTAVSDVLTYVSATNVPASASATNGQVGAAGESIYIRVTLDHTVSGQTSYEGLNDQNVVLAVNGGTQWDATLGTGGDWAIYDVHYDNGADTQDPCPDPTVDDFANDIAYQDVKARPTVQNSSTTMPAPGLVPIADPNP